MDGGSESRDFGFEEGLLLGVLIGEGHFGGDRRQPQITLKMHVRHEPLLRHFLHHWPGARLYGPYDHDNRHYFQLMFRGAILRYRLVPLLSRLPWEAIDPHTHARFLAMLERYQISVGPDAGLEET
ncbi:MAG TPA: hypothetical protein VGZ00_10200 [Candidatus Baltobacteraceae bacterium]|nr:hypothetical protein [Candidatus Baltobacteraceae bacterium]